MTRIYKKKAYKIGTGNIELHTAIKYLNAFCSPKNEIVII